jgi:transcriptional regulator GlxA family with amidase domain
MTRNVGIYIFDEIEVLDLGGPFEVFSTASRMKSRLHPGAAKPFEVFTIADAIRPVRARGGLRLQPDFDIANHPAIDIFIVPGGVVTAELKRDSIIKWIAQTAAKSSLTLPFARAHFCWARLDCLTAKPSRRIGRTLTIFARCFLTFPSKTKSAGWMPERS